MLKDNKKTFQWQDYMHIFFRRKWLFAIPFVLIICGSIIASFFMPKVYQARAIILVEDGKMLNPLLKNLAIATSVSQKMGALREEILGWPHMVQLAEKLGLDKEARTPLEFERFILNIRQNISLQMKGDNIVTISYQSDDPRSTQELVNTLCDILIARNIASQSQEADSAIYFIKQQLADYKKSLEYSEEELRKFKEKYELQMPLATELNNELANLESELTAVLVDCTDEHPRVKELRRRIESLKRERLEQIKAAAQAANADPEEYVRIAESIPMQEQELTRLTRGRNVNERIYGMLLQKLETARITQKLEDSENKTRFKIIEPARLPLKPTKPNKLKIAFLGIVLGAGGGFGCAYSAEYMDSSFKRVEDLRAFSGDIPVLGSVSKIRLTKQDSGAKKTNTKTKKRK